MPSRIATNPTRGRYLVTGGAGFIGSNLVAELTQRGDSVVVCDWLGSDDRWRNLAKHEIADFVRPEDLPAWLRQHGQSVQGVLHMGAVSSTTESDVDLILQRNFHFTIELLQWCTSLRVPLIYASSAATYGDGSAGFDDVPGCEALARLRPLNPYGWSKHLVDQRVARLGAEGQALPPQCVGLKFFNVYGPNEYHKGPMASVIAQNYARVMRGEPIRLFRSGRDDYADGGQLRDFIYVKDCVALTLWLLQHPEVSGLFNVGSGRARSWLDLAHAVFRAVGRAPQIEFIDMPANLAQRYQYLTEARTQRVRAVGYDHAFSDLESGVSDYVQGFLSQADPYR